MLQIWGKEESIIGLALMDALPELDGQPFLEILNEVYTSGIPYFGNEQGALIEHQGILRKSFFDFVYQPIKNAKGQTTGIMVVANDVSESLMARDKIKSAEDTLRLSLKAAQLGTFDMDLTRGTMFWDARCRELFGIDHYGPVSYDKDFLLNLHEEDRERIHRIIEKVYNKNLTGGEYDVEYRTIAANDKRLRWVRAMGKTFFNENDVPVRFIGSVLDITDKKMEEARRNDFFAMASHELKTPLTTMMGYLQLLQASEVAKNDEILGTSLERMGKSMTKMSSLIQGFLNHARITESKFKLHILPINLIDLANEAGQHARMLSAIHTIEIVSCKEITIIGDHYVLSQVLENLISNAIKYSPHGGKIIIGCKIKDGMAEIFVQDEGIGISEYHQARLFERFYRVQNENTKTVAGFGIGLYLVSEMLRYHNSEIKVESTLGKGSRFYFNLPLQ